MLTLTPEQFALLSLPDPYEFAPALVQEIRQDFADWVQDLDSDRFTEEVVRSYGYGSEGLHLTHLPTLVKWIKADVAWARGLRRDLGVCLRISQSARPDLAAIDILSSLQAAGLWPREHN